MRAFDPVPALAARDAALENVFDEGDGPNSASGESAPGEDEKDKREPRESHETDGAI